VLAAVWSVIISSRGQVGHVGAAPPCWGLAAGEVAVDGHRLPSAGVGREYDGRGHVVREREGQGRVLGWPIDWAGQEEKRARRRREESARVGRTVLLGRARERGEVAGL
jgi:hypothetical protein